MKSIAECGAPEAAELVNFADVVDGGRYFVDVAFDGSTSEWLPTSRIDMPHHHSSRIEWVNLEDFPELVQSHKERLRFTIDAVSREIEKVPEQSRWWARYKARIGTVCRVNPK